MPLWILLAADEALEFRIVLRPADGAKELKTLGNLDALQDKLRPLAEKTLARKPLGSHRPAHLNSLWSGIEIEAGNELHAAKDAQRVFAKMVGDMAQCPALKICAAIPRIDYFASERIAVNGVDGKVAAGRGVANRQRRVVFHLERTVPEAELSLAARDCDVNVEMRELYDAEARADKIEVEFLCESGL